jgi:hypothetical protein
MKVGGLQLDYSRLLFPGCCQQAVSLLSLPVRCAVVLGAGASLLVTGLKRGACRHAKPASCRRCSRGPGKLA